MYERDSHNVVFCLEKIAQILHHKPGKALAELREIAIWLDKQLPFHDGHIQRVADYSIRIGKRLNLSKEEMVILEASALLHDFGKLCINKSILKKQGTLTESERREVQNHVLSAYYILSEINGLNSTLEGVRSHHEHFDGSGYPDGLSGNLIPLHGRIIAVADAYDAMTSERPYRKPMSRQEAIQEIVSFSGTQFDPEIARLFIEILEEEED